MTTLFNRDIPPRAAIAVVALALVASLVFGREKPAPAVAAEAAAPRAVPGAPAQAPLDLAALERRRLPKGPDLFAPRDFGPAPAARTAAAPSPAPRTPPPLPFTYLGRVIDRGKTSVFLARGDESLSVRAGQKIDGDYRVERIAGDAVTFVYLPMKARQTLSIPATN